MEQEGNLPGPSAADPGRTCKKKQVTTPKPKSSHAHFLFGYTTATASNFLPSKMIARQRADVTFVNECRNNFLFFLT